MDGHHDSHSPWNKMWSQLHSRIWRKPLRAVNKKLIFQWFLIGEEINSCDQRKSKCDQMRAKKELAVLLELSIKKHDSVIVSTCECDKERIKGETLLNIWLFSHQNVIVYSESWEITTERRRKPELDRYLNKNLTHVKQNEQKFCTHRIYIISSLYLLS